MAVCRFLLFTPELSLSSKIIRTLVAVVSHSSTIFFIFNKLKITQQALRGEIPAGKRASAVGILAG